MPELQKVPRPENPVKPLIAAGPKMKVAAMKGNLPEKYWRSIKENVTLNACCREVETSDMQYYRTDADLKNPDILHIVCGCGRRQIRMGASGPNMKQ